MLSARALSAVVLIPLTILVVLAGGGVLWLAAAIILVVCGIEFILAFRSAGYRPFGYLMLPTIVIMVLASAAGQMVALQGTGMAAFLLVGAAIMVAAYGRGDRQAGIDFALTLLGTLYIGWLGAHIVPLRALPDGHLWAMLAMLAAGLGDVGAYTVGRLFGRRKMAPVVSPAKTWEGYFGGVLFAALTGLGLGLLAAGSAPTFSVGEGFLVGTLIGVISPIGDLSMSALKREVGVKNFSNLIPGHGGMLDRMDSVLFALPLAYYLIVWLALAG